MRYVTLILGILAIAIVSVAHFYPNEVLDFIEEHITKREYVIAKANDYYLDYNYSYINNYTDDVSNKEELLDYIYYVINTGRECTKEYTNCYNDLKNISDDEDFLTTINNFVHPFNSFKTISFSYNTKGDFSLSIEHVYSKEEIAEINYIVDKKIDDLITTSMTSTDKIKAIHDFVINNTEYDELKSDNIGDTTYKSNTAYGVLIQGYGICSGYADTMAIFLNKLGIKNYKISNDSHIWNLVYVNGKWVHLDATWDDPISEYNANRDTYFLIDTEELTKLDDGTHKFDKNIFSEAY